MQKKVLFIRLDKIGDLICTLPTDQILDDKTYDVTWVVQKGMGQIIDFGERHRKYIELDKADPKKSQKILARFLAQNSFDYAVSFQCPWWVNWQIFKAGIKHRIGVLSQWHSFLFLNEGLRQKKSKAIKHEFEYNLDLALKITGPIQQNSKNILFKFKKPNSSATLEKFGLKPSYIVVHPGMMGSALNWPQDKYIEYIQSQIDEGKTIVVTGTAADEPYLKKIKSVFEHHEKVKWLQSQLNFSELLEILNYAEKVIAPSTGVAHIAAALGKEVHAIFSPIRVHHPIRWAPRGENIHIHLPTLNCPTQVQRLNTQCLNCQCMRTISI